MEMQDPENFCGMSEMFHEILSPIMEKFDILFELEDAYEDYGPILKIAGRLLHEVDEIFKSCAHEFFEDEDLDMAINEWMKLRAITKLNLIKAIHRKTYL